MIDVVQVMVFLQHEKQEILRWRLYWRLLQFLSLNSKWYKSARDSGALSSLAPILRKVLNWDQITEITIFTFKNTTNQSIKADFAHDFSFSHGSKQIKTLLEFLCNMGDWRHTLKALQELKWGYTDLKTALWDGLCKGIPTMPTLFCYFQVDWTLETRKTM